MSDSSGKLSDFTSQFLFEKVAFIGLGLIGSSLCRVIRNKKIAKKIVAYDISRDTLEFAKTNKLIDIGYTNAREAVKNADLIILAVPVNEVRSIFEQIKSNLCTNAIITDVGSTKGNIVDIAKMIFGSNLPIDFVPGHPIAGSERSGISHGSDDLFENHRVVLTPLPTTSSFALDRVTWLWQQAGADVVRMTVDEHDEIFARTSHLPHLLAFTLMNQLGNGQYKADIFSNAAGGLRDFSRIAGSDPKMWMDIFLGNRIAILSALNEFQQQLDSVKNLIESNDFSNLFKYLSDAQHAKEIFYKDLSSREKLKLKRENEIIKDENKKLKRDNEIMKVENKRLKQIHEKQNEQMKRTLGSTVLDQMERAASSTLSEQMRRATLGSILSKEAERAASFTVLEQMERAASSTLSEQMRRATLGSILFKEAEPTLLSEKVKERK